MSLFLCVLFCVALLYFDVGSELRRLNESVLVV